MVLRRLNQVWQADLIEEVLAAAMLVTLSHRVSSISFLSWVAIEMLY